MSGGFQYTEPRTGNGIGGTSSSCAHSSCGNKTSALLRFGSQHDVDADFTIGFVVERQSFWKFRIKILPNNRMRVFLKRRDAIVALVYGCLALLNRLCTVAR